MQPQSDCMREDAAAVLLHENGVPPVLVPLLRSGASDPALLRHCLFAC